VAETFSLYIEWAKTRSQAKFNLATSGVVPLPILELSVSIEDIELSGPSWYGYDPLQRALARKCRVEPENVVAAIGTSMANFLAMAATLEPGDDVVIESPAYDPLIGIAKFLGANVNRFDRSEDQGFRVNPDYVARAVTKSTRLIVITNLHNPTGAFADQSTLLKVGEIARGVGARVLVDEVYLEAMFDEAPPSAFHLGSEFIATGSLTKAYGLSGLRCGWILAEPALAHRMWRLNDLFGNIAAHPAERLSVVALGQLDRISARAQALLNKNRAMLDRFLDSRQDLQAVRPKFGTVVAPRVVGVSADQLCELLREKYETSVVPGRYFGLSAHIRVGFGCASEMLAGGLERLGAALDELAR
jgi:aspartate/methionine/tyrosine aminotransferase